MQPGATVERNRALQIAGPAARQRRVDPILSRPGIDRELGDHQNTERWAEFCQPLVEATGFIKCQLGKYSIGVVMQFSYVVKSPWVDVEYNEKEVGEFY